jgi:membrane protein implicated in regulation of membrane protease activity
VRRKEQDCLMSVRLQIAAIIFMMVQGVFFGLGAIIVLATPLKAYAPQLIPLVIAVSLVLSMPTAWMIAPLMRSKHQRQQSALIASQ